MATRGVAATWCWWSWCSARLVLISQRSRATTHCTRARVIDHGSNTAMERLSPHPCAWNDGTPHDHPRRPDRMSPALFEPPLQRSFEKWPFGKKG